LETLFSLLLVACLPSSSLPLAKLPFAQATVFRPLFAEIPFSQENLPSRRYVYIPLDQENLPSRRYVYIPLDQENLPSRLYTEIPLNQENLPSQLYTEIPFSQGYPSSPFLPFLQNPLPSGLQIYIGKCLEANRLSERDFEQKSPQRYKTLPERMGFRSKVATTVHDPP